MNKWFFVALVVLAFFLGYFFACGDVMYADAFLERTVYEFSEANATGAGGVLICPKITVGTSGAGGASMPSVIVYGDGRGQNNVWQTVMDHTQIAEGQVIIDTNEYESYYYRVVVIK